MTSVKNTETIIKDIAFRTFISVLFCTVFGYIFWAGWVFNHRHTAFLYIAIGTIGSLFFYTLRYGFRKALGTLQVSSLIFSFLIMRSWGLYSLRNFLVIVTSASILYIYFKVFYGLSYWQKILEPLILGMLFAIGNLLAFMLLVFIGNGKIYFSFLWAFGVMEQYFLIGLGIGIGIIITENPYSKYIHARIHAFFE